MCRFERRLLEANADGSRLAALDDSGNMSVYALNRGQASTLQPDFYAEGVSSVAWNTDHAEVHQSRLRNLYKDQSNTALVAMVSVWLAHFCFIDSMPQFVTYRYCAGARAVTAASARLASTLTSSHCR